MPAETPEKTMASSDRRNVDGGRHLLVRLPPSGPKIQRQVNDLKDAGIDASYKQSGASAGGAAHAIADAATEVDADLVVVGTRGQGPVSGLLLGSVTNRLLHVAPCAVLAVPPCSRRTRARWRTTPSTLQS